MTIDKKPSLVIDDLGIKGYTDYIPTDDELLKSAYEVFEKEWHISNDENKTPVIFKGRELKPRTLSENAIRHLAYIGYLFEKVTNWDRSLEDISKVFYYEEKGGLCIYLAVLTHWLLWTEGVKTTYCQGIYRHKTTMQKEYPPEIVNFFGNEQAGNHAWLEYKDGAIIDIAIAQQREFFEGFDNELGYIIGKVPNGFLMKGYKEDPKTVKQLARDIAKLEGKTFYEWIEFHKKISLNMKIEGE